MDTDHKKSKAQLIAELDALRTRLSRLEQPATQKTSLAGEPASTKNATHDSCDSRTDFSAKHTIDPLDWQYQHQERIKELQGIISLGLLMDHAPDLDTFLQKFVTHVVPPSMQFPDQVAAVVNLDGKRYSNSGKPPYTSLNAPIKVSSMERGSIEVGYLEDLPFIPEFEQRLVNTYARNMSLFLDRFETRRKLQESEHRFRLLTDNMQDILWIRDADFQVTYISPSVQNILGFTPEEAMQAPLEKRFTPESIKLLSGLHQRLKAIVSSGQAAEGQRRLELEALHKNGSRVWLEVDARIVTDENGDFLYLLGVSRDVTQRKLAEDRLRLSESRHRCLVENFPGGAVFLFDNDLRYNVVGGLIFNELGLDPAAFEEKSIQEAFPEIADIVEPHAWKVLQGRSVYYELEYRGRVFSNYGVPVLDDSGRIIQGAVMSLDITARKRSENALRESEQRFRDILNDVEKVSVQGYDENRKVIYWNSASERLYGWTRREAAGRRLEDLIIPESMQEKCIRDINRWLQYGERIPAGEMTLRHKDGSPVFVYSSHSMRENAKGKKELFCVDIDMAEIKKAHAQIIAAKEKAEKASRAKSEFLANMSHEIRTPMNGILGMLQLLQTTDLDSEQDEYVFTAIQASKRLTRLLSDILDLSRVEAGRLPVHMAPLDLFETVEQVCEMFKPTARQSDLEFSCHVHPGIPRKLCGDSTRLQQILTNIIGNAFKFTKQGEITVQVFPLASASNNSVRVLFSISDTGIGIPDDKIENLFKPFTQVSRGYQRDYQGAGLGLSICKRLIDLMQGSISIESEVNAGTAIHFCISFEIEDSGGKENKLPDAAEAPGKVYRILLAEDDEVNRISTAKLFEKKGHAVTSVENGRDALLQLKAGAFDLILMDIQMPVMDGVKAAGAIRSGAAGEQNRNIPIIAVTAYAMNGDRDRFLNSGMDGYIAKPVVMPDIEKVLKNVKAFRS